MSKTNGKKSGAKKDRLSGVYPVFQTPWNADETIDVATLDKEIQWMYDQGVDGIVMAMVSETLRLDTDEREQLAELSCKFGSKRGGVIISVGAESSKTAERYAKHAESVGADAVMAIPPVSIGVGNDELLKYYERIIKAIKIPVVVQDASGYVGKPMPITMQAQLLKDFGDRVMYKPEASPIGPKLSELRDATKGKARVFEGTGGIALVDSHRRGIIGTMPGADLCWALVALWNALEAGDEEKTYRISGPLGAMIAMQTSLDAFLAVEKYLLVKQGIFRNQLIRGPVAFTLDKETAKEVDRLFNLLQRAVKG